MFSWNIKSDRQSRITKRKISNHDQARDIEIQFSIPKHELEYTQWWTRRRMIQWFHSLPESTLWNCYICLVALMAIVWVAVDFRGFYFELLDIIYNTSYAFHILALGYNLVIEKADIKCRTIFGFCIDLVTYFHYASKRKHLKLCCYYLRLHRPFRYLWALNDYNLKGSVLGTALKYCYIFLVLRVTWALIWLNIDLALQWERENTMTSQTRRALSEVQHEHHTRMEGLTSSASQFLSAVYIVNKMFIPIGPSIAPANDIERITCLLVMLTGCLVVTGAAVASLSLVISLYMRPEETFRARYRLIMKEMRESQMPQSQREKVETFYKMYWHKQRAVSATQLLPTFPPTLPTTIYTDIYFEATQKTRILRDLTYQFLSELAKKMETIHYIPGDAILKRSAKKSSIIYIAYGDIEMVTAEDDSTAILRMTRGTVLTPCGGCAPAGFGRAHLEIRAATFCTAHVLNALDLWRVAFKYGRNNNQAATILASFNEHLEKVKKHLHQKIPEEVRYKSSILHFKRYLTALKEAKDSNGNLLMGRTDVLLEIAGCYIMRNRADVSLTDEADAICLRPTFPCILQPMSSLQVVWHSFVACLILAVCITHPYYLIFKKTVPLEFRFFDYVVTAVYVLDLIVHLSTGANVEEGVPITFAQTSSQQMRSHWFVLDVVGTVPIFEFIGDGHFSGLNKILRLPKVFRVLKNIEDICVYRSNVLRFLSYTLLLLIACYLIAAMQQGFMCFQFGYCQVSNFTHSPYWEDKPLDEATVMNRLSFGLYWAISMITFTSHMETWGTENWNNVLYTMFVLEICIVLRIFMEAIYSATIMVTTALREDYDSRIAMVKNFLIKNEVDPILRQRFITYLQLCWYTDKAYSMTNKKRSIFFDLPSHVNQDIVARQRNKYILCIPFMKYVLKEDLKDISSKARLFYTSPNEILINTGDISNEMYIIKQGICEIISPETKSVVASLSVRNHFGVIICLLRLPAYYTIRAVTHVQVFCISRKHLLKAIEVPQIKDAIEYVKELPEYARLLSSQEPFLLYEPPQPTPIMERFRLPRKYEQDSAFLQPFNRLGFLSVLRYVFPRFTIRPDGEYLICYEWFRAFCALSSAMVFPSYAYLVLQWPGLYFITKLLDTAAFFDIFQRMLVGYFNEQGILVYHPTRTAAHYLKGAFIIDLFGCIALENLESSRKDFFEDRYKVTKTKQFLMLNRLLQLYRLPSAMLVLPGYIERRDILIVLKAIPVFIALLNVLTCFIVLYSVDIFYASDGGWILVPYEDSGGSWINLFSNTFRFNLTESPGNLHLAAYFWVVYETTTTGYNCFNPSNFDLMHVLFIGKVIGAMIITYFLVRIISIRANVNKALAAFQEHMKDMVVFMRREKLDPGLQKEVLNYYTYSWDKMGGVNYRNVLKLCDQITLRTDAILHIYGPTFANVSLKNIKLTDKCPILSECDVSLLRIVGRAVRSMYCLRGMRIIDANEVITDMYFVDYGGVNVRETFEDLCTLEKLPRGSMFGNLDGAPTFRCPVALVATSKVHLLIINSEAFHHIISDFPAVQNLMKKYRQENTLSYIMGKCDLKYCEDRSLSSPLVVRSRKSYVKYLNLKNKTLQMYLIVVSLVCIYADVYNAGFQDNKAALIIALYVLDMAFYLKILLQFSLPYIVETAHTKNFLLPLRRVYFKGEFKYDMISCLPIELFSLLSNRHKWMLFSWLRLNRMFRVVTLYKCLKHYHEQITINLILSTFISVFIWFTLFVHTTACLWHFIGVMEDFAQPNSSWMHYDVGGSWCHNYYVCSLYFVLTTFTQNGVGDIMPKKQSEVVFVSILQIVSTMVYMVYVGEFSNIIQYQSFRSFSFYSKYLELQEFLKNNRVSKNLVTLVNKYSLHLWREKRGVQVPYFLETAPHCLRLRIMAAAYLHHLTGHHIFQNCEPAFLRQLVGCLQLYTYNENMYVVKANEITDSMYLIHTGRVQETDEAENEVSRVYSAGSYFGVGLLHDTPYTHSYRTLTKSQVLTLRLIDWMNLMKHFSLSRNIIHKYMKPDDDNRGSGTSSNDSCSSLKPPKDKEHRFPKTDMDSLSTPLPDNNLIYNLYEISTGSPEPSQTNQRPVTTQQGQQPLRPLNSNRTSFYRSSSSVNKEVSDRPNAEFIKLKRRSSVNRESQLSLHSQLSDDMVRKSKYIDKVKDSISSALISRMATTAKKLMEERSDSHISYTPSKDSSEQDMLFLKEDEEATNIPTEQFDEKNKQLNVKYILHREVQHEANAIQYDTTTADYEKNNVTEKRMTSVDIIISKHNIHDIQQSNTELEKPEEQAKQPGDDSMALVPYDKKIVKEVKEDKQNVATSSKMNKRNVRVGYEDSAETDKTLNNNDNLPDNRPIRELSMIERNDRFLDSDIHANTFESENRKNAETELSSKDSSSSTSVNKKKLKIS